MFVGHQMRNQAIMAMRQTDKRVLGSCWSSMVEIMPPQQERVVSNSAGYWGFLLLFLLYLNKQVPLVRSLKGLHFYL